MCVCVCEISQCGTHPVAALLKGGSAFETVPRPSYPLKLPRPRLCLSLSAGRLADVSLSFFFCVYFLLPLEQFCPLSLILNAQCALLGVDSDGDVNANAGSAVSADDGDMRTQFA